MAYAKDQDLDFQKLTFGKYVGKTPEQISECAPGYVVWMYENVKPLRCSEVLYRECKSEVQENKDGGDSQDDTFDRFSRSSNV